METIILASASPRRRELLSQIGISYDVIPSKKEEKITSVVPTEIVMELAKQKAEDVVEKEKCIGKIVLGADTIVTMNGEVMGKPKDEEEAFSMISKLQNATHQVYTGVSLSYLSETGKIYSHVFYEETLVKVYPMSKQEILDYFKENSMELRNEVSVVSNYYKTVNGDYETVLNAKEGDTVLVEIKLSVPTGQIASSICDNWNKKNQEVYQMLTKILF